MERKQLPGVGFEYSGIDLTTMSDADIKEFGKRLIEDNVVVIRDQNMTEDQLVHALSCIGRLMVVAAPKAQYATHPTHKYLTRVTNRRDDDGKKIGIFAEKELHWHSNGNFRETGRECCVALYCVEPGDPGTGITSFVDTRKAFNDLPDDLKELVEDVDVNLQFENKTFYDLDEDDPELAFFNSKDYYPDGVVKPLVYKHPFSGEKGLYFAFYSIVKMWRRSGALLDEQALRQRLIDHVFQEKYIYHHDTWRKGDLILMDQFHSLHRRSPVQGDRFLWRVTMDYRISLRENLIKLAKQMQEAK